MLVLAPSRSDGASPGSTKSLISAAHEAAGVPRSTPLPRTTMRAPRLLRPLALNSLNREGADRGGRAGLGHRAERVARAELAAKSGECAPRVRQCGRGSTADATDWPTAPVPFGRPPSSGRVTWRPSSTTPRAPRSPGRPGCRRTQEGTAEVRSALPRGPVATVSPCVTGLDSRCQACRDLPWACSRSLDAAHVRCLCGFDPRGGTPGGHRPRAPRAGSETAEE